MRDRKTQTLKGKLEPRESRARTPRADDGLADGFGLRPCGGRTDERGELRGDDRGGGQQRMPAARRHFSVQRPSRRRTPPAVTSGAATAPFEIASAFIVCRSPVRYASAVTFSASRGIVPNRDDELRRIAVHDDRASARGRRGRRSRGRCRSPRESRRRVRAEPGSARVSWMRARSTQSAAMPPRSTLRRVVSGGGAAGVVTSPKSCRSASVPLETEGIARYREEHHVVGLPLAPDRQQHQQPERSRRQPRPPSAIACVRRRPPIAASARRQLARRRRARPRRPPSSSGRSRR